MKYRGSDFLMQILDGGTWTSCLSDRSTSFIIGNDQVEVTSKSDNDWRNLIAVGTRTAEITASGVWTDRRAAGILMSSSLSSSPIQVRLIHGPSGVAQMAEITAPHSISRRGAVPLQLSSSSRPLFRRPTFNFSKQSSPHISASQ